MVRSVYIDTSIVGGLFDDEFQLWTELFFDEVHSGNYKVAVSDILLKELRRAPRNVRDYLDQLHNDKMVTIVLNRDAEQLADLIFTGKNCWPQEPGGLPAHSYSNST